VLVPVLVPVPGQALGQAPGQAEEQVIEQDTKSVTTGTNPNQKFLTQLERVYIPQNFPNIATAYAATARNYTFSRHPHPQTCVLRENLY
jgi:hypothetical protein